uniref:Uncharacterized protein n=1 Tax=Tetranychus urticae TaxID=32264 RepID=A0A158P586_TETUR
MATDCTKDYEFKFVKYVYLCVLLTLTCYKFIVCATNQLTLFYGLILINHQ